MIKHISHNAGNMDRKSIGYGRYLLNVLKLSYAEVFTFVILLHCYKSSHCNTSVPIVTWWRNQMETFSALLALCAGNSKVPVNSPHKGQWRGALMFSLICARINDWVNNREAGDLRRYRGHYDVTVMSLRLVPAVLVEPRSQSAKQETVDWSWLHVSTSHNSDPNCMINENVWHKTKQFSKYNPLNTYVGGQRVASIDCLDYKYYDYTMH